MLTESQIDALQIVINNPVIMDALGQVFTETVKEASPVIGNEDNTVIGEKYRAYDTSKGIISNAFTNLISYKKAEGGTQKNSRHI